VFAARSRLADLWDRIRSSYWFVPSVMFLGAILLALGMVRLDVYLSHSAAWTDSPMFQGFAGSGARSILSTIASGMVTVTALVFSLTIVSLQLASSQFGPRLLRTFMKSLGNQVVLGTFTSTFVYCLVVIGTVRDDGFVPQLSTATGILLGIVAIAVLIYFIHHVATSIRIENLIAEVTADLRAVIDERFPSEIGESRANRTDIDWERLSLGDNFRPVCAAGAGYIRRIDSETLMSATREHDLVVRVERNPGDFVVEGALLFSVWPKERVTDEVGREVRRSIVLGAARTPMQDVAFAVRQLVEVALRALSPGINDPFTAIECANRLAEGLCIVVRRPRPSAYRFDDERRLRVIAEPMDLRELTHAAFDPIARAGGGNGDVALHLLQVLATIAACALDPGDRRFLIDFALDLELQLQQQLTLERDRQRLAAGFAAALAKASVGGDRQEAELSYHP
jgi:uncharacterized membrane protein